MEKDGITILAQGEAIISMTTKAFNGLSAKGGLFLFIVYLLLLK